MPASGQQRALREPAEEDEEKYGAGLSVVPLLPPELAAMG
jgi:hypothetical protein